jgi:DNA-binding transcriptional regulator YdaS (Cro superfamily)
MLPLTVSRTPPVWLNIGAQAGERIAGTCSDRAWAGRLGLLSRKVGQMPECFTRGIASTARWVEQSMSVEVLSIISEYVDELLQQERVSQQSVHLWRGRG